MELSELADYAKAKYNISEQHKWSGFPGFSILADPTTGEWLALLMRQRSPETGAELRRCDIKCGQECLYEIRAPFLSLPFRMKGQNWAGVSFDGQTDPQTVFRLFDRAVERCAQRGAVVVLEEKPRYVTGTYTETALPFAGRTFSVPDPEVPQRIREMYRLYESGDSSFVRKCRNFYRQGKFMEDYTDDLEWTGDYRHYFATYHDLSIRQLRGYFTWRTHARKGEYRPLCTSLAYLYLYELLCGIGADSPEESLRLARDLLEEVGIGSLANAYPNELSGGEMRRLAIARALIREPGILLADEPTGDLDDENTKTVLTLLRQAADRGAAVLLVTHEGEALPYADRVYRMNDGILEEA